MLTQLIKIQILFTSTVLAGYGSYQTPWYDKPRIFSDFNPDRICQHKFWPYSNLKQTSEFINSVNCSSSSYASETEVSAFLISENIATEIQDLDPEIINLLTKAIQRFNYFRQSYLDRMYQIPSKQAIKITEKQIFLKSLKYPTITNFSDCFDKADCERFKFEVTENTLDLEIGSVFGAFHVLTNLLQDLDLCLSDKKFVYEDQPYFQHRGLLVDTARHFHPIKSLKRLMAGMAFNKLNIFHWHFADDQVNTILPAMHEFNARNLNKITYGTDKFVPFEANKYSKDNVFEILEFARIRGIAVVPEVDTPGHTQSWNRVNPELSQTCHDPNGMVAENDGPLSIFKDATVDFVENLINSTYFELFENSKFMHLGMDEVRYECWNSSVPALNYLESKGFTDFKQMEEEYSPWKF